MEQAKRVESFSYIRAIACFAIVVLHMFASASILYKESLSVSQIAVSRAVTNCMMWAVPCFVMTTGALLLDEKKEVTFNKIFRKYIPRVLGALIVFGMVFRLFDMFMDKETVNAGILLNGLYEIFTGTSWSHMWYLYLLIGLYLLLPFYRKIAKHSDSTEMKYLLVVYVVFLSILPLTQLWNIKSGFYIHVSTIYPFYLFCGYAVHKKIIRVNKWTTVLAVVFSTACIWGMTILRWKQNVEVLEQLWKYSSVLVIIQSVGIFILLENIKNGGKLKTFVRKIDSCSFGIYLIHMIWIRLILRYMKFNPYENHVVLAFFGVIFCVFIVSYFCVWVLKKIPGFKKIL